jgi:hypothetical protein
MTTIGQLSNEYLNLRSKVLNLCYQLPYPQTFKEPINIEMVDRYREEIIGIDEDGYLINNDDNTFCFESDVVGAGELVYLLETLEEQKE